jgi:hypothetical protein
MLWLVASGFTLATGPSAGAVGFARPDATPLASDPAIDGTWARLSTLGPSPTAPSYHGMAYDPTGNQLVFTAPGGETWTLLLGANPTWVPTSSAGSRVGVSPSLVYDPVRRRMVLFGGGASNETWTLSLDGVPRWTPLQTTGDPPVGRSFHIALYDPSADRMIVQGGWNGSSGLNDTWMLSLGGTPTWSQLQPTGDLPPANLGQAGVYDPVAGQLVLYGGYDGGVYRLNLLGQPRWERVSFPSGAVLPQNRGHGTAVYSEALRAMVLFGGYSGSRLNDVWLLNLSGTPAWQQLLPGGTPPNPTDVTASIYQPVENRMLVFGGIDASDGVFELRWTPSPTAIVSFAPRAGQAGTQVRVNGLHLAATTAVSFGGVPAGIVSILDTEIRVLVPSGASTGPIAVTTPEGTFVSQSNFIIGEPPSIASAEPQSAKLYRTLLLHGRDMGLIEQLRFTGSSNVAFQLLSDSVITVKVVGQAHSGPLFFDSPFGAAQTSFSFTLIPWEPAPHLVSIGDVPNDQGGRVILRWDPSDYDTDSLHTVQSYRIWRRAPLLGARPTPLSASTRFDAGPPGYWEVVGQQPAARMAGYAFTGGTFQDSLAGSPGAVAFVVQALTADANVYYFSAVDSGYSVDNLAPPYPGPLRAVYGPGRIQLAWPGSRAPDLREYRVYRGGSEDFALVSGAFVAATGDTTYTDRTAGTYFYKVVAVDVHGNISRVAVVGPDAPVSTLLSLAGIVTTSSSIVVTWSAPGNPGLVVSIYRRVAEGEWTKVADGVAGGTGLVQYRDTDVVPGARYGYRVGVLDGEAESFFGTAWATAENASFAVGGLVPNPSHGARMALRLTLPSYESVRVDVLDVSGRRVRRVDFGSLAPGAHELSLLETERLPAGVYLVRLFCGQKVRTVRGVVLN